MKQPVRPPTILYFAPVAVGEGHGVRGIPAVRNKVLGVLGSLRAVGVEATLVSTIGDPRAVAMRSWLHHGTAGGYEAVQVYALGHGPLRRVVATVTLLFAAIKVTRPGDRVVLYNFFPEYLLVCLWLLVRKIPCFIDIEDAPRADERGVRGVMNRWSFSLLRTITQRRYLIVSDNLARALRLKRFLTVYGVASHFDVTRQAPNLFDGEFIRVNYGGAMVRETGIDLFAAAMRILARKYGTVPIHIFVTGHLSGNEFVDLVEEVNKSESVRMQVVGDLDYSHYIELLETMNVGLCLKLPSTLMGQTTFPSKVIEIAAKGMLLVTTAVSDVPLIFDNSNAIILRGEDPDDLALQLANLCHNRATAAERARRGQRRVADLCNATVVGTRIRAFLEF